MTITQSSRRACPCSAPTSTAPAEQDPRPTGHAAVPVLRPSGASNSRSARTHATAEAASPSGLSVVTSRGTKTAGRRAPSATHGMDAAGTNSQPAPPESSPIAPARAGLNSRSAVPGPATVVVPIPLADSLLDPALSLAADVLDDIERVRIANENRIRQMTRSVEDKDGEVRGFGFSSDDPDVLRIAVMVHALQGLEHDATLELQRKMRRHPLGAWMKAQRGIGEKQGARLLAAIGDPYWRPELVHLDRDGNVIGKTPEGPRTVSALWAYCGLHVLPGSHTASDNPRDAAAGDQLRDTDHLVGDDHGAPVGVAAKRRKGQRANWSTRAKMRAYLIAESCMKTGRSPQCRDGHASADALVSSAVPACDCSPYRLTYENRRAHTAITHPEWTDGHSHNDALRVVSKEVLKQLWRAARDWHLANGEIA